MVVKSAADKEVANSAVELVESASSATRDGLLSLTGRAVDKGTRILFVSSLRRPLTVLILMMMDTLSLLVGFILAGYLIDGGRGVEEIILFAPVLLTVWLAVFVACSLYGREQSRRDPGALLGAILLGAGLLGVGSITYPQARFSLGEILLGTLFIGLLETGTRFSYERGAEIACRWRLGLIPTLIVGEGEERTRVRQMMEEKPSAYACVGELSMGSGAFDLPLLRQALDQTRARNVILAGTERLPDVQFLDLLRSMSLRGVKLRVVPDATTLLSSNPVISRDTGMPLLEIDYPRLNKTQWALKRMLDVAGSLAGLVMCLPLFMVVAVLIKLTSSGAVFFRQKRVGTDGRVFTCYKFRSMYEDAERRQAELEARNEADGAIFKIKDDPRVTPVGRVIRRLSIDELPQLINVFMGEMSLVGPRPLPLRDFEQMSALHKKRLATIPGITGYWQISGRSNLAFDEMVRLDLYYIENWSLSLDIKIILKTFAVVLRREGAY